MPHTPRCVYCSNLSHFTVTLRNEYEYQVGALHFCNDCKHLIEKINGCTMQVYGLRFIKMHITDVPANVVSDN